MTNDPAMRERNPKSRDAGRNPKTENPKPRIPRHGTHGRGWHGASVSIRVHPWLNCRASGHSGRLLTTEAEFHVSDFVPALRDHSSLTVGHSSFHPGTSASLTLAALSNLVYCLRNVSLTSPVGPF